VPAVHSFVSTRLAPHCLQGVTALGLVFFADAIGQAWHSTPALLTAVLRFPATLISLLVNAVVLLSGIASIGIVALLPGAYVVHLLGLSSG
jgi:hypothetical protein